MLMFVDVVVIVFNGHGACFPHAWSQYTFMVSHSIFSLSHPHTSYLQVFFVVCVRIISVLVLIHEVEKLFVRSCVPDDRQWMMG